MVGFVIGGENNSNTQCGCRDKYEFRWFMWFAVLFIYITSCFDNRETNVRVGC